jgi:hypothetical protein
VGKPAPAGSGPHATRRPTFRVPVTAAFVTLVIAAFTLPVSLASSGCAGDDCDADVQSWGSCAQGDLLDANHWESGPVTGPTYLDFHGERTWVLDPSPWMGTREPVGFQAYLALGAQPTLEGGTGFAQSAGNLAEFTPIAPTTAGRGWKVQVLNDTCAQYWIRVVLEYADEAPGATHGGTCGGSSDASAK